MADSSKLNKDVELSVVKQVAAHSLLGKSVTEIAKSLNISAHFVRKAMSQETFKDIVREQGDQAVINARNTLRAQAETLAPEVWQTIAKLIRADKGRDNAEGIKAYFRLIGLDKSDEAQAQGDLIINLPGSGQPPVIEISKEGDEEYDESTDT